MNEKKNTKMNAYIQLASAEERTIPSEVYYNQSQHGVKGGAKATQIHTAGCQRRELVVGDGNHDQLSVDCQSLHEFLERDTL